MKSAIAYFQVGGVVRTDGKPFNITAVYPGDEGLCVELTNGEGKPWILHIASVGIIDQANSISEAIENMVSKVEDETNGFGKDLKGFSRKIKEEWGKLDIITRIKIATKVGADAFKKHKN